jgi:hypothetical protein
MLAILRNFFKLLCASVAKQRIMSTGSYHNTELSTSCIAPSSLLDTCLVPGIVRLSQVV